MMEPMETVKTMYALLFWFVGERHYSIQNTSTIAKPRREPEEYGAGDIVIARFRGKAYRAAIVRLNDDKDKLLDDVRKLENLLKDSDLSPTKVMEQMGVAVSLNLDDDTENRPPTQSAQKTEKRKRPETEKPRKDSTEKAQNILEKAELKKEKKIHKEAGIAASRLMANKLIEKMSSKTATSNINTSSSNSPSSKTVKSPLAPSHQILSVMPHSSNNLASNSVTPPAASVSSHQVNAAIPHTTPDSIKSAFSVTLAPHQIHSVMPHSSNNLASNSVTPPAASVSSHQVNAAIPHTTPDSIKSAFSVTLAPHQIHSVMPHSSNNLASNSVTPPAASVSSHQVNSAIPYTTPDSIKSAFSVTLAPAHMQQQTYQQPSYITNNWQQDPSRQPMMYHDNYWTSPNDEWTDYSAGSPSSFLAENFKETNTSRLRDSCTCMPQLRLLEQRVLSLESRLDSLVEAGSCERHSGPRDQHALELNTAKPDENNDNQSTPATIPRVKPHTSVLSVIDLTPSSMPIVCRTQNSSNEVELAPGYAVTISVSQLDTCLRKAKKSGTALARLLLVVFFGEETLSKCSARGTKTRPALDICIINAIIKFVTEKMLCPERDVVQAINGKCTETRSGQKKKTIW